MDYTFLLHSLEQLIGKGKKTSGNNHAFHCPFCNHHKPKLEINLATTEEGSNYWECWVCQTKGKTVKSLLYQLKVPKDKAVEILKFLPKGSQDYYGNQQIESVSLPKEFQPLATASTTSVVANQVKRYLYARKLSDSDFIKYNIGYCTTGDYGGRIIIPSYNSSGVLNYFVGRSFTDTFLKYKNPKVSKDIIFFENLINWDQPLIICEGTFDAMAIKRNAIPILGKNISKSLTLKILQSKVQDIYIALDKDALSTALKVSEQFLSMGKKVYLVEPQQKDPSEMGFQEFTKLIQTAQELDLSSLLMHKLEL